MQLNIFALTYIRVVQSDIYFDFKACGAIVVHAISSINAFRYQRATRNKKKQQWKSRNEINRVEKISVTGRNNLSTLDRIIRWPY